MWEPCEGDEACVGTSLTMCEIWGQRTWRTLLMGAKDPEKEQGPGLTWAAVGPMPEWWAFPHSHPWAFCPRAC